MRLEELQKAGLSQNEAKSYLALLKLGSSSANEISRNSGIHRVSVYDALRGLREKGLISQITQGKKMLFEAGNPENILSLINEQENILAQAKKIIPSLLLDFQMNSQKQEIRSYKGKAGIKSILKEMLTSKTDILDFGAENKISEMLPFYYPHWDKERCEKNILMRIIANIKFRPTTLPKTNIKYVSEEFHSTTSTYIYDNKMALVMWVENPLGVVIEHEAVYESYKNYFEMLWRQAKE